MGKDRAQRAQDVFAAIQKVEGGEEKMNKYCEQLMEHNRGARCRGCWLVEENCACEMWKKVDNVNKVVVHIHHGEWARSSNSGVCIHRTLNNSLMLLKGFKDHQAVISKIYEDDTMKCILWPGEDAISVSQLKELAAKSGSKDVVLIVPDGSFRGARKMVSKYPSTFPRVRLSPSSVLKGEKECLMAPVRKYGGSEEDTGRVSTLEAVAAYLEEMGEESAVPEALEHNMRIKMDMVLVQKHRPMLYGTKRACDSTGS